MLGVINLADPAIETRRAGRAAHSRRAEICRRPIGSIPAPDCGMKYLARDTAFGKLAALSAGAAIVRGELS